MLRTLALLVLALISTTEATAQRKPVFRNLERVALTVNVRPDGSSADRPDLERAMSNYGLTERNLSRLATERLNRMGIEVVTANAPGLATVQFDVSLGKYSLTSNIVAYLLSSQVRLYEQARPVRSPNYVTAVTSVNVSHSNYTVFQAELNEMASRSMEIFGNFDRSINN